MQNTQKKNTTMYRVIINAVEREREAHVENRKPPTLEPHRSSVCTTVKGNWNQSPLTTARTPRTGDCGQSLLRYDPSTVARNAARRICSINNPTTTRYMHSPWQTLSTGRREAQLANETGKRARVAL